jgi:hypothetical protein
MQFIANNREKLSEIYEMEHQLNGIPNPENQGNPGCLIVTRKQDRQVDIFYYGWSAMEPSLQSEMLAAKTNTNIIHMVLIDNIVNKSMMVAIEKKLSEQFAGKSPDVSPEN